jgi:broad specificity phosphatase PhoE
MTARLVLICHASTDAVRKSIFPDDEPLDAHGLKDAAALAGHLPHVDRCWTSPELRTRQTAEAMQLNADVQPMLRECDYGHWRDRSFDEVNAQEPEAVAAWLLDPSAAPHGGETIFDLMKRVATWLAGEQPGHQRLIIVTHATIIRAAIVHALEAAPRSFWRIDIAPLSITRLSGANGRWNVASAGCISHRAT